MSKKVKLQRLWNNLVSLRDYNVKDWIKTGTTIVVTCDDREGQMTITPKQMEKAFQVVGKKIESKFGKDYYLVDLKWRKDEHN